MEFFTDFPSERHVAVLLIAVAAALLAGLVFRMADRLFFTEDQPSEPGSSDKRQAEAQEEPPSTVDPDTPPPIKIMVLGMEGFGKTMMMAGMYYQWASGNQYGVVLEARSATKKMLSRLVERIVDPDGGLPESTRTGDTARAEFTFMVDTMDNGTRRPSFNLRYIDYAGEQIRRVLLPSDQPPDPEVEKDLAEADILLGVLDGGEIARAMRSDARRDFAIILTGLMIYLANVEDKTVHLVISKWDLLVDENGDRYTLSRVIEFLNQYPPFAQFCEKAGAIGVRRIIPISTFGLNGFVRVDERGLVHKNRSVPWRPFMAENAIACSVPDVIDTDFDRAVRHRESAVYQRGESISPLLKVMLVMCNRLAGTRVFDINGLSGDELISTWRKFKKWIGMRSAADETEISANLRVLRLFDEAVRELERQFPESKINRPYRGVGQPDDWIGR